MRIDIEIPDQIFTIDEKQRLAQTLGINLANLEDKMQGILLAAFIEYKEMLLGKGLPTRADEIKQHRLLHLVKHYFKGRIPSETEVSGMFQLTEAESKSLIKNVMTRFRYQLEEEIYNTGKEVVENCELREDKYEVAIQSDNVLERLNWIIRNGNPDLESIRKIRDAAGKYSMTKDTYQFLENYFGLDAETGDAS